jgi:tetraacyldisaccharide 4'-kinase
LKARGLDVHLLTRGYRGRETGLLRVDPALHDAAAVGDEALLLARVASTWRAADRAEAARRAVEAGAQVLVMDDGLQNPTLMKTLSFLVIDGGFGFGNGRVLPAGPLRETVRAAASRSDAAVLIGEDQANALARLPRHLPVLQAQLQAGPEIAALVDRRVVAFAGIGRPEKFFSMLQAGGVNVLEKLPFPDHHPFTEAELASIRNRARDLEAVPVTTQKDAVRIPATLRPQFTSVGVSLRWQTEPDLEAMLDRMLAEPCPA